MHQHHRNLAIAGMFYLPGVLSPLVLPALLSLLIALAAHAWSTARRASAEGRAFRWARWPLYVVIVIMSSYRQGALLAAVRADFARAFVSQVARWETDP